MRGNEQHEADMEQNGIENIDLIVMNLYPFEYTVSSGAKFEECVGATATHGARTTAR